jgi:predicted NAD/FAD-binding protein
MSLAHPVYSFEAVEAQRRVGGLQGTGGVYFAGAWCGYGFHEDGIKAGIAAATAMGASVPWTPRPCSPHLTLWEQLCIRTFDRFCK